MQKLQKLLDRDLLAALVLFAIGAVALANAGADPMNWAFPLLAAWFIMFAAALLLVRAVYAMVTRRAPDIISVRAEDRFVWLDVFTFLLIALGYLLVMFGLGFWLASFLMLALASVWLTPDRTRHNLGLAVVVPLATCVVAYVVFQHVFYVPVPQAHWWPLGG
jgi:Tripartite tricarboxylate transporter TctB family